MVKALHLQRSILADMRLDLEKKIILLSGPRQTGKTTLSKSIFDEFYYLNYDDADDRLDIKRKTWDRSKPLVILDEIHKMPKWKSWLKGVFDKEGLLPRLLVTGSARLDIVRKMGDSLAGRFFQYRLYPLDIKELAGSMNPEEAYDRIIRVGGFPEPLFDGRESFYNKWKKSHLDIILRQDMLDLESPREISAMETLITLLQRRVGSTVSYSSLARDLEKDPKTVKRWLTVLENLFVIFRVIPYHSKIARSLLKEPKYYFYDIARVIGDEGAKMENLIALSIRKELDFQQDAKGVEGDMFFLRTKDGRELDFYVKMGLNRGSLIEAKLSDDNPSSAFRHFDKFFPNVKKIQLVKNLRREKSFADGVQVRSIYNWLKEMPL